MDVFPIMFLLFRCLTCGFFNPLFEVFGSVPTETYPVEAEKIMLNKCNMESTAGCCFSMLLNLVAIVFACHQGRIFQYFGSSGGIALAMCGIFSVYFSALSFSKVFFFLAGHS